MIKESTASTESTERIESTKVQKVYIDIDGLWRTLMTFNNNLHGDDVNGMALWQFWLSIVF